MGWELLAQVETEEIPGFWFGYGVLLMDRALLSGIGYGVPV
jgi:hypothetical protein